VKGSEQAALADRKRASLERMLFEAREDIGRADQKASILLAALGVGFAAVLGGQLAGNFNSSSLSPGSQILWWIGVAGAVASVAFSAAAVWPRYKTDDSPRYGITYWGHIAAFEDLEQFEKALATQDTTSERRTRHQLWRVSGLVRLKYQLVRAALVCGGAAGVLLGLAAVVIR
jgi:Family of unknown function (DUF5706)